MSKKYVSKLPNYARVKFDTAQNSYQKQNYLILFNLISPSAVHLIFFYFIGVSFNLIAIFFRFAKGRNALKAFYINAGM